MEINPNLTQRYFQDSVVAPMMRTFNEQIRPAITEGFAGVGAFSSRLGAELSRAATSLNTDFANQAAQLAMHDRNLTAQLAESAANRRMQAVGLGTALRSQPLADAAAIESVLSPFQQRTDAQAEALYSEWQRLQPENSPWLTAALNYLGQSHMAMYQPRNPIGSALGGAIGGAAVGSKIGAGALSGLGITSMAGPFGLLGALGGFFSA